MCVDLVLSVLLNEGDEILNSPRTIVLNRGILGTSRIEANSRKSSDRIGNIVGSRIDLGDSDLGCKIRDVGIEACEFLILWSKTILELDRSKFLKEDYSRFAMSTPRCVKLNEDILLVIDNKFLVGVSHNDGNRAFLCFWNRLRFDARLNLAI